MLFIGIQVGRLVLDGGFGWFVQQRMRIPLAAATLLLVLFGAYGLLNYGRRGVGDSRGGGPSVGWLLVLPVLVLVSVAPTALGASAADRVDAYVPTEDASRYEPLADTSEPLEMRVFEFLERAVWDPDRSVEDRVIRLEGLVVNDPGVPDGFKLTRFMVSCCAADGIPLQVTLHDTGAALENDTWVVADVIWRPPDVPYQDIEGEWVVEADVVNLTALEGIPQDPYESPY